MGKRRKRMIMARYAKKYAKKRMALGFGTAEVESKVIVIDMANSEETDETVEVVYNTQTVGSVSETPPRNTPEPQLQTVQVEEPVVNALKETTERKTPARRKKTPTAKKTTATKGKTTTRRKTTKKAAEK